MLKVLVIAVVSFSVAGCGVVQPPAPDPGTLIEHEHVLVAYCEDLECDAISCTICYACPGVPYGATQCTCIWWDLPSVEYLCYADATDPFPEYLIEH